MSTLALPLPAGYEKRPLGHFAAIVMVLVMVAGAFAAADWDFAALTDPRLRSEAAGRLLAWLAAFASPDVSAGFLVSAWELTLQTLSTAVLGTTLAVLIAWPLAMGASRAVCVGDAPEGRWHRIPLRSPAAVLLCAACRLVQDVLRAVPDFVWAIILVAMIGLGPLAGALALALNVAGILAKVYSELWDSIEPARYAQVRSLGGGRIATFLYGIRPLASRNMLSFTLMRAECAIRNAAVIGAVGGGGLGAEIWYQIRFGAWDKVSTLIVFTLLLTLTADLASGYIRRQLRGEAQRSDGRSDARGEAGMTASGAPALEAARPPLRPWIAFGFIMAVLVWSLWFMGWGNRAGDEGTPRNHLEPAVELFTGQAWDNLAFFERLLAPELDLPALGLGDAEKAAAREAEGKAVALFEEYGPADVWRPAAWSVWRAELQKWFVWRVIESAAAPLAIAFVGTLLGVAAAVALSYPHSTTFQLHAARFTGETPPPWRHAQRALQLALARAAALVARGVPELMWAFLFIAFFGAGLVAGTLAIAVHTLGVLVRVFGESVDNQPLRRFEPTAGASRLTTFGAVAVPLAWRDWMTYSFFQFESNVRAAVVMGLIGVGGLGFQFGFNFEWFRFERAGTYLLAMILLTALIDRGSRRLKLSRASR